LNFNNPPFRTRGDIAGLKVTVMGLGLNGGGLATARFFAANGAEVTITDKKGADELAPSIAALADFPSIRYVLGTHEPGDFSGADAVIKNPGVKLEGNPYLQAARSIETDVSVFLRFTKAPILAVTGSKGKSSTVSALHFALRETGYSAFLGGNITVSPLTFLDETTETTPVVLELSSWQLADLKGRGILKPRVAIITPVMSDHQNWYGGMEPYVADKKLIYADQDENCHLLCNRDDEWGPVFARETRAQVHWYSASALPPSLAGAWLDTDGRGLMRARAAATGASASGAFTGVNPGASASGAFTGVNPGASASGAGGLVEILPARLAVPGAHMRQNLLNAAQAMVLFGADPARTAEALARFPGIEHRLERFHDEGGVAFYNDSAATIPEAAAAAVTSFDKPVILLTGGTDKNLEFSPLAEAARAATRVLLLAGSGTDKLIPLLERRGIPFDGPYPDLASLVARAREIARDGDIVVFSPGATSFGLFQNEFDRGRKFKATVTGK